LFFCPGALSWFISPLGPLCDPLLRSVLPLGTVFFSLAKRKHGPLLFLPFLAAFYYHLDSWLFFFLPRSGISEPAFLSLPLLSFLGLDSNIAPRISLRSDFSFFPCWLFSVHGLESQPSLLLPVLFSFRPGGCVQTDRGLLRLLGRWFSHFTPLIFDLTMLQPPPGYRLWAFPSLPQSYVWIFLREYLSFHPLARPSGVDFPFFSLLISSLPQGTLPFQMSKCAPSPSCVPSPYPLQILLYRVTPLEVFFFLTESFRSCRSLNLIGFLRTRSATSQMNSTARPPLPLLFPPGNFSPPRTEIAAPLLLTFAWMPSRPECEMLFPFGEATSLFFSPAHLHLPPPTAGLLAAIPSTMA